MLLHQVVTHHLLLNLRSLHLSFVLKFVVIKNITDRVEYLYQRPVDDREVHIMCLTVGDTERIFMSGCRRCM